MVPSEEDIEWELDEGVPQFDDPFIQKYLDGRDALIDQEHTRRHGKSLRVWCNCRCGKTDSGARCLFP